MELDELTIQDLAARLKRVESGIDDIPALQLPAADYDARVPSVTNLYVVSASIAARLTKVAIMWLSPDDTNVARYEVWVARIANGAQTPYLAASVNDSPASFNITSDAAGHGIAFVRTVMKNGLTTPPGAAPSIPFQVF
jgi:hypothetical protein